MPLLAKGDPARDNRLVAPRAQPRVTQPYSVALGAPEKTLSSETLHEEKRMPFKTKLRTRLEALTKGKSLRISGITKSRTTEYDRAYSTVRNCAASSGRKFRTKLGARTLMVMRTR